MQSWTGSHVHRGATLVPTTDEDSIQAYKQWHVPTYSVARRMYSPKMK
jgi:hypothetical protein